MGQFRSLIGVSPFERDPTALPLWLSVSTGLSTRGTDGETTSAFWDDVTAMGDYQTGDPSSATRTALNVTSGAGSLRGIIGPVVPTAGTTTITVTVDGNAYVITATHAFNSRAVVGDIARLMTQYTTANHVGGYSAALTDRGSANVVAAAPGSQRTLLLAHEIQRFIKFDVSLKIEFACSSLVAVTNAAYCGAIWNLDG